MFRKIIGKLLAGGDRPPGAGPDDAVAASAAPAARRALEVASEQLLLPIRWLEGTFEFREGYEEYPHIRPDRLLVNQGGRYWLDEAEREALVLNTDGWSHFQTGGLRLSWNGDDAVEFKHADRWIDGEQPLLMLYLGPGDAENGRKLTMQRWQDDHAQFFRDFCETVERAEVRDIISPTPPKAHDWDCSQFGEGPVRLDIPGREIRLPNYVWPTFNLPRELQIVLSEPLSVTCAPEGVVKTLESGEYECRLRGYSFRTDDPDPVAEFSHIELWPLNTRPFDVYVSDEWIFDAAARGEISLAVGAERWWKF